MPKITIKFFQIVGSFMLSGCICNAIAVTAMGTYDCGQWFSNPSAVTWLAGYLSGLNAATPYPNKDPLDKLNSGAQMKLWMDNYCKANPLETVGGGANELYRELAKKP